MKTTALLQLGAACALFIIAASSAKAWALSPSALRLLLTLALYTAGNLLMLRLIRKLGWPRRSACRPSSSFSP